MDRPLWRKYDDLVTVLVDGQDRGPRLSVSACDSELRGLKKIDQSVALSMTALTNG
jgi:hypothetical protein